MTIAYGAGIVRRSILTLCLVCAMAGCTNTPAKSADVEDVIQRSLKDANLKDVSVKQDRDKGIVTLTGHVPNDAEKAQAEAIARSSSGGQVVANEIAVLPPGVESEAKTINADLDKGIEKNLDAALVARNMKTGVSYSVKNGVVTLSGTVNAQSVRDAVERVAAGVPNVRQVVNTLQIKDQKATSRGGGI